MYRAMIKKSKNKKGFTLVELIVVMAILAILAAILIPAVGGMIRRSNEAVDVATARNLYMAGSMVLANNDGDLKVTVSDGGTTVSDSDSDDAAETTFINFFGSDYASTTSKTGEDIVLEVEAIDSDSGSVTVTMDGNNYNPNTGKFSS